MSLIYLPSRPIPLGTRRVFKSHLLFRDHFLELTRLILSLFITSGHTYRTPFSYLGLRSYVRGTCTISNYNSYLFCSIRTPFILIINCQPFLPGLASQPLGTGTGNVGLAVGLDSTSTKSTGDVYLVNYQSPRLYVLLFLQILIYNSIKLARTT